MLWESRERQGHSEKKDAKKGKGSWGQLSLPKLTSFKLLLYWESLFFKKIRLIKKKRVIIEGFGSLIILYLKK